MKLKIAVVVPGMAIDPATYRTAPLGGSETAGLHVAYALAARGHEVILFLNTVREVAVDGMRWLPLDLYAGFAATTPHDVALIQRTAGLTIAAQQQAKVVLLWCHDLLRKRDAPSVIGGAWALDRVLVVSEWMRKRYLDVTELPIDRIAVVENGLDMDLVDEIADREIIRQGKALLYCSRFERGVDVLLEEVMPRIWARDPEVTLDICGYKHHVEHLAPFYAAVLKKIGQLGPRVRWRGHLDKPTLYGLMRESSLLVYPTPSAVQPGFAEVSCIVAMEAMANGLPVVASAHGALPETLGEAGSLLVDGNALAPGHVDAFADRVLDALSDRAALERVAAVGRVRARCFDWRRAARRIETIAMEAFAQVNDSAHRLAAHLVHRQDIEAAERVFARQEVWASPMSDLILETHGRYAFMESNEAMARHYATLEVDDYWPSLDRLEGQPDRFGGPATADRLMKIAQILAGASDIKNVLDYGCAHGEGSIIYHNVARIPVLGLDINGAVIERARRLAVLHADPKGPGLQFLPIESLAHLDAFAGQFDAVVAGEILEHVLDPFATLEALHRCLAPGGLVVITMPWGPWEAGHSNPPQHIREWTRDDLREVFGGMADVTVASFYQGVQVTMEPCGYSVVTYRWLPDRQLGTIDWDRKLTLQRPRQTLSLNMLVGGAKAHETLHWSLASVAGLCDEIIIGDTGMTAEARRIAESYGAKIFKVDSPLVIGFDAARNELLERSQMDWILWLDSDERLVDADNLRKYLRESPVDSYAIKQHHWAIDSQSEPDRPGRLFRNRPIHGKRARFYGVCHEHPEIGLNEGIGHTMIIGDLAIGHVGYTSERTRNGRFDRNKPLLERDVKVHPERELQKHLLIRDHCIDAKRIIVANGGAVPDNARRLLGEAIDLYRTHFLGKPPRPHLDTLGYYSYACRALNLGFDVDMEMTVAKDGVGRVGPGAVRFATVSDLLAEMTSRMKSETEKFEDPFW